jgi:3-deoxy-D-manno-octulosonate 8-phosphate phosphatase KdsC-like HAD superfamily phosphatase
MLQQDFNTVYIDFHGVLTDGKMNLNSDGTIKFESCHMRDTMAIRELVARGYVVWVCTASSNPIIDSYCEKVGILKMALREKEKLPAGKYIAIGDSSLDIPMFTNSVQCYCPADAAEAVRNYPGITVLNTAGGKGCMAEIVEKMFNL